VRILYEIYHTSWDFCDLSPFQRSWTRCPTFKHLYNPPQQFSFAIANMVNRSRSIQHNSTRNRLDGMKKEKKIKINCTRLFMSVANSLLESWIDINNGSGTQPHYYLDGESMIFSQYDAGDEEEDEVDDEYEEDEGKFFLEEDQGEEEDDDNSYLHRTLADVDLRSSLTTLISTEAKATDNYSTSNQSNVVGSLRLISESELQRSSSASISSSRTTATATQSATPRLRKKTLKRSTKPSNTKASSTDLSTSSSVTLVAGISLVAGLSFSAGYALGKRSVRVTG
jgi:hypothetical protein